MKINGLEREFLYHSNQIEEEFSQEALEDAMEAWKYAKQNRKKINLNHVLKIHKILMSRSRPYIAGRVRDDKIGAGPEICKKKSEKKLKEEIRKLVTNYKQIKKDFEEEIEESYVEFEKIHPFDDGNGRVGRILMNIYRLNYGLPILVIHEQDEQTRFPKLVEQLNCAKLFKK